MSYSYAVSPRFYSSRK